MYIYIYIYVRLGQRSAMIALRGIPNIHSCVWGGVIATPSLPTPAPPTGDSGCPGWWCGVTAVLAVRHMGRVCCPWRGGGVIGPRG